MAANANQTVNQAQAVTNQVQAAKGTPNPAAPAQKPVVGKAAKPNNAKKSASTDAITKTFNSIIGFIPGMFTKAAHGF